MSLSTIQSPIYVKDSFEDRICDDLCQYILQFLPFNDKIRLESVSKQFQRTVVHSQRVLRIKLYSKRICDNLEIILKKFFIHQIHFDNFSPRDSFDTKTFNRIIYTLTKHCRQTTRFSIGAFDSIFSDDRQAFLQKFGHNLTSAQLNRVTPEIFEASTDGCLIERLNVLKMSLYLNQIQFKRIKHLKVDLMKNKVSLIHLNTFANRNRNTLRHLTLKCHLMSDQNEVKCLLHIISKFNKLIHLEIYSPIGLNLPQFLKQRKQMGLNCKQLKSIVFRFLIDPNICTTNTELLSPLRHFQNQLKRLRLDFFNDLVSAEVMKTNIQFFSFEAFKGFEELTHLSIDLRRLIDPLDESILTGIDVYLPKLQYLSLHLSFNASKWTADILSRLSRLEAIELFIANEKIRPHIESTLRKCCKKLRKIKLNQF